MSCSEYRLLPRRERPLRSRKQLNKGPVIGAKIYEQFAAFQRIGDGKNPLDCTAVQPKSYPVVEQIARSLDTPVAELIANLQLLTKVDPAKSTQVGSQLRTFWGRCAGRAAIRASNLSLQGSTKNSASSPTISQK
jgi:transcriptional accessory protein Tex/SPT6